MERNLLHWSYWLGIACSVVALLRRVIQCAWSLVPDADSGRPNY